MSKEPTTLSFVTILDIEEIVERDVAIVRITADMQYDNNLEFVGVARRNPLDKSNSDVALLLATSRAWTAFASKLQRRAQGLVAQNDSIQAHRKLIKNNLRDHTLQKEKYLSAASH